MSAALALLVALVAGLAPQQPAEGAAPTLARWREDLELDQPQRVLAEGPAAVAPDGPLAAHGEARALVARALFGAGRADEARALLERDGLDEATRAWAELERARQWIERDELARAVAFLREGATPERPVRHPERPESWLYLGRALVRSGEHELAVPFLEQLVRMEPLHEEAPAALHMLAQAALRRGDGAEAASLTERAQATAKWRAYYDVRRLQVREQPDEPLPRLGLAQLWLEARDAARARAVLEPLVARFPDFAPGWFHLGEALRLQGELAAAAKAYDAALERDPEHAGARYNRAVIALRDGRSAQARADLERVVASPQGAEPRFAPAHLALARLLAAAGDGAGARARYARYLELGGQEPLEAPDPPRPGGR